MAESKEYLLIDEDDTAVIGSKKEIEKWLKDHANWRGYNLDEILCQVKIYPFNSDDEIDLSVSEPSFKWGV